MSGVRGVGIDVVEIERVRDAARKHPAFLTRICTLAEADYCSQDPSGHRLAGRFAAKEAVGKAIGEPLSWHDVEVLPDATGRPQVTLHGKAKERVGGGRMHVSISHSRTVAAATAVWTDD